MIARNRTNLWVYARDGAVINGISGAWRLGELPSKDWPAIRATYWGVPEGSASGGNSPEFTLGRFVALARFFALSKATTPGFSSVVASGEEAQ